MEPWKTRKNAGHLRAPSADEVRAAAAKDHIELTQEEAEQLVPYVAGFLTLLDEVEELPEFPPGLRHHHRDPGRRPAPEEDPYTAFVRLCRVEGAADGPLAGKRVAAKDNLAVAGVPISNGSRVAGYVPTTDAR